MMSVIKEAKYAEAVARGLDEMARSILFTALPQAIEMAIGEQAAAALLLRVFSRSAYEGFKMFMEQLGTRELSIMEVLTVFTESFPVYHPFRVFTKVESTENMIKLVYGENMHGGCSLVNIATIAGAIEGVLRAIGMEAKAVLSKAGRQALCRTHGDSGLLVIYPMNNEKGCHIVIEKLSCKDTIMQPRGHRHP